MPKYYPEDELFEFLRRVKEIHVTTENLINTIKRVVPSVEIEKPNDKNT